MPASSFIRAAFFALGAAVGGGTVVAINASRKKEALAKATTQALPPTGNGPFVEVGVTGPRLSQTGAAAALAAGPVLKYGNPGMYDTLKAANSVKRIRLIFANLPPGPIFDQLVRRAYVAGYDRRLRHPAWVSSSPQSRPSFFCPPSAAYKEINVFLAAFSLDGRTFDTCFPWEIAGRGS